ncbi:MAG TPA: phosphate uptake regulator PhoU [Candidatus Sulfotelmatobacter sp.]|nr:phosphate uptake regulator PhoU [Candidatus Sulfotelmatobacter sp.]
MERRIMSLGRSSMVISLPKNWMQLNELKKGDVVSFAIQRDRSLVIYPSAERKTESKATTLRVGQNEDEALITRRIIGAYLNGYSGITLVSEKIFSIPQRKAIRNIAQMLYMRIMESDTKGIYIQTLIDESQASLEQAIQRMHLISQSMCEDIFTALKNEDQELAKAVFSLDDDVDHFLFFILRLLRDAAQDPVLANELRVDPLDCMDHQNLVYRMEQAADYAADIAKHMILLHGTGEEVPNDIRELMVIAGTLSVDMYAKSINAFFSKDIPVSVGILKNQEKVEKFDQEIATKSFTGQRKNAQLVCAICSMRDNIKRIADCAADIAKIAINRAFKTST